MTVDPCLHESELLDALGRGFIDSDLRAHLNLCASCSELELVAGSLLDERVQAMAEAPIPSAGTMWWRMQVRHRAEVQATARRSLLIGQAMTLGVALALMVSLLGADLASGVGHVITSIRLSTPLLLALVSWIVLAPIAGYVAIRQK